MADEKLQIKITAIDKTKQAFNSISNKLGGLKKAAGAVGIAVGAIGAAFVAAAKKTIDFADEIAKTADKVGLSTSALQELRVAADLAGISQGELDSGLGSLSKRMGELRQGTGALNTFLDKSDPAFKTLLQNTTDNEQAFRLVIGKLDTMTNAQDRTALSSAALGRALGVAASKLSLPELDAGIKRARDLGLVIDEKLLRNAEGIKDQFTLASRVIQTQFMEAMLRVMKEIDFSTLATDVFNIAKSFLQGAVNASKFFGVIERSQIEKKTIEIQKLDKQVDDLHKILSVGGRTGISDKGTLALLQKATERSLTLREELRKLKGPIELPKVSDPSAIDKTTKPKVLPISEKELGIFKMEEFMDDVSAFANDFEFEIEKTNQIIKDMAVNVDAEMQKAAASFQLPKTPLEELKEKAQDTFGAMQDIGARSINRLEDSIMGVIDGTKSLKDAFADMATSILNDLIRMQIQQSITGPLSGFLSQGLGSLFSDSGATFTSGFAGAPAQGFADGGVTSSRRPYMVGEKGPEMFVPNMTGRVVPNNALGGGAVTVNVINNTGAETRTEEREGPNGAKSIDVFIDEAVARNISTPGSRTGRAMRNSFAGLSPQLAGR